MTSKKGIDVKDYLEDVLLTIREVFDYTESIAEDYGGGKIMESDYEVLVVRVPTASLQDYLDVIMGLADGVTEHRWGYRLFFDVDPEERLRVSMRLSVIHRYHGWSYVAVRVDRMHCPGCPRRRESGGVPA